MSRLSTEEDLGYLPLQAHDYSRYVGGNYPDIRPMVRAIRVLDRLTGEDDVGTWVGDETTEGDVIGSFLWENIPGNNTSRSRPMPAWRFSWPVVAIEGKAPPAPSPGTNIFGQINPVNIGAVFGEVNLLGETVTSGRTGPQIGPVPASQGRTVVGSPVAPPVQFRPLRTSDWDEDERFVGKDLSTPEGEEGPLWPKFAVGWHGLALAGDEENSQEEMFFPADPRLVAVNFAGDPKIGSMVIDLDEKSAVDETRIARLQSLARVIKAPIAGCFFAEEESTLAWNIGRTGQGESLGGLMYSRGVLGHISAAFGGPIDLGGVGDVHQLGADADGNFVGSAHISGEALYRFFGTLDGPLRHNGSDDQRPAIRGPGKVEVDMVFDPRLSHFHLCGEKRGRHRWYAFIPDIESEPDLTFIVTEDKKVGDDDDDEEEPIPGVGFPTNPIVGNDTSRPGPGAVIIPPEEEEPLGVSFPGGDFTGPGPSGPRPDRFGAPEEEEEEQEPIPQVGANTGETFVDTPRARGISQTFYRAQWQSEDGGDEAPNFCQWKVPDQQALNERQRQSPVTLRMEAFGRQRDEVGVFNLFNKLTSRYRNVITAEGGIMVTPANTSLDQIIRGDPGNTPIGYFGLADDVYWALGGSPDLELGTITGGFLIRTAADGGGREMRIAKTLSGTEQPSILRIDNASNVLFDFALGGDAGGADAAGGVGMIAIDDASSPPSGTPADGVVLWAIADLLRIKDTAGMTWILNAMDDDGRIRDQHATALDNSDVSLNANWGTGATVTAMDGTDMAAGFVITAGSSPGADPVATLTFKNTWTTSPSVIVARSGGTDTAFTLEWTPLAATLSIKIIGTPTDTQTTIFFFTAIG